MNLTENLISFPTLVLAVRHSPKRRLQVSYDEEGDALYAHFVRQPKPSTYSDVTDEDIIVRYNGDEIIGITILRASER